MPENIRDFTNVDAEVSGIYQESLMTRWMKQKLIEEGDGEANYAYYGLLKLHSSISVLGYGWTGKKPLWIAFPNWAGKQRHDKKEKEKEGKQGQKKKTLKKGRWTGHPIQTGGIELNDQFSGVLNNIISSVNLAVSAMYMICSSQWTLTLIQAALKGQGNEINQATAAIEAMNQGEANRLHLTSLYRLSCGWGTASGYKRGCKTGNFLTLWLKILKPIRPGIQPNAIAWPLNPVENPGTITGKLTGWIKFYRNRCWTDFSKKFRVQTICWTQLNNTQARILGIETVQGMDIPPDAAEFRIQEYVTAGYPGIQQRIQQDREQPGKMLGQTMQMQNWNSSACSWIRPFRTKFTESGKCRIWMFCR